MIADYETIDIAFGKKKENPRYIYFFGKSDYIQEWLENSEKVRNSHNNFLSEIDNGNGNSWNYDDGDDDLFQDMTYNNNNTLSDSKKEWFVDEDYNSKKKLLNIQKDNDQNEVKVLKDKIQSMDNKLHSMEENIKNLVSLLQNQQK